MAPGCPRGRRGGLPHRFVQAFDFGIGELGEMRCTLGGRQFSAVADAPPDEPVQGPVGQVYDGL